MLADGYDYNYCHENNYFSKECMLHKLNEKKENVKEEAYYTQKIEELWKKNASAAKAILMVQDDSDDGQVEVWSIESEVEEVRKPAHGRCFVVISDKWCYAGTCVMIQSGSSEKKGYATDDGKASDICFAM